ncbi:MAG: hypothetical protein VW405_18260 [Rhodospirillaceae bacterium]
MRFVTAAAAALLIAPLAFAGAAAAVPCAKDELGANAVRVDNPVLKFAYRTDPATIAVGKPFSVEVIACGANGEAPDAIAMDAGMPHHGHGMNYKPSMRKLGPGHAAFDGLVFHMPGRWMMQFDVTVGGSKTRVTQPVTLRR